MRLASGQRGIGLRGMQSSSKVPECQGMHGVWESGYYERAIAMRNKESAIRFKGTLDWLDQMSSRITSSPPVFEYGGVKIMRPLLKYDKRSLIDTCKAHGIPWMEDETNQHTWRTPRNTIRSLLKDRQLPVALNRSSLIRFSVKMAAREMAHTICALELLRQCKIILLDVRSGSVVVRLPRQISERAISAGRFEGYSVSRALIASLLLRILAQPISPCEEIALHTLQYAARFFFAELNGGGTKLTRQHNPKRFTAAGVQFERINVPLDKVALGPDSDPKLKPQQSQPPHGLDEDHIWALTRQPFPGKSAATKPKHYSGPPSYMITIEHTHPDVNDITGSPRWSPWYLWDGRYWIRVMNRSETSLIVRPFREADLQSLRVNLSRSQIRLLEDVLAAAAPGKVRWTLPVIARVEQTSDRGPGKVIGLPSLGKAGIIDLKDENDHRIVDWEIRYKRVVLGKPGQDGMEIHRNIITSWEDS